MDWILEMKLGWCCSDASGRPRQLRLVVRGLAADAVSVWDCGRRPVWRGADWEEETSSIFVFRVCYKFMVRHRLTAVNIGI